MSTNRKSYKKPSKAGELYKCEYAEEMKKVYSQPLKQTETKCEGYRNKYTNDVSHVCKMCPWFSKEVAFK